MGCVPRPLTDLTNVPLNQFRARLQPQAGARCFRVKFAAMHVLHNMSTVLISRLPPGGGGEGLFLFALVTGPGQ